MTVADVLTGPATGLVPLLSLGPAFAPVLHGWRNTALIGAAALAMCAIDSAFEDRIGVHAETLAFVTVAGVTATAVLAAAARQRREQQLTDVHTIAEVAQQVVLRPVPATASPVSFTARYLSASAHAHIGGDLYEVMPGPDGTTLMIGDVTGKGLVAVQTAATVLGAFRAAADDGASLEAIAARIEASLRREATEEEFATAVLASISADGSKVSLLNCGHPPPLLLPAGGPARPLEPLVPGLPLGLAGLASVTRDVSAVALRPGDGLLLYTDGISEARGRDGEPFRLAGYCSAMDWRDPGAALDGLHSSLLRHTGRPSGDDAALLLVTRAPGRPARQGPLDCRYAQGPA